MPCRYKIIVQWVDTKDAYEAFAPSLLSDVNRFLPGKTLLAVNRDPVAAMQEAMSRAMIAVDYLQEMGISPPEADNKVRRLA